MAQRGFSRFLICELRTYRRRSHCQLSWNSACTIMLSAENKHGSSSIPVINLANVVAPPTIPSQPTRCLATQTQQTQSQIVEPSPPNVDQQYEECIRDLNTLQTNAVSIRRSIFLNMKQTPLADMQRFLKQGSIDLDELEKIPLIHVSGTKGKGSTCALTESILRAYGVKTAFFSSPHLVSVTERIRINGKAISKQRFVRSFRYIFDRLKKLQKHEGDMPSYFKFLTMQFFKICMEEKVDVIILEVGVGGEMDCTNVIRTTETVGITSLGLDHTQLLGNTLSEIAWQKAGIIKLNSDVYTSVTQPECLEVIKKRVKDNNATLHIVPEFENYLRNPEIAERLQDVNEIIKLNGSLAIQLAYNWLRKHGGSYFKTVTNTALTREVETALLNCQWPGRCQVMKLGNLTLHIDGAHTVESLVVCGNWFNRVTTQSANPRVLIFNTTGDRDSHKLLEILHSCTDFTLACFTPNIAYGSSNHKDNTSVYVLDEQLSRAQMHSQLWLQLGYKGKNQNAMAFHSILDCLKHTRDLYGAQQHVDVLVTGSLHLVGALMMAVKELKPKAMHMTAAS